MAKEQSEQKANLYLLAIVAIVAVVGIVVLVLNSGSVSVSGDLSGQAIAPSGITGGSCAGVKETCQGGKWQYDAFKKKCICIVGNIVIKTANMVLSADEPERLCTTENCLSPYMCKNNKCVKSGS